MLVFWLVDLKDRKPHVMQFVVLNTLTLGKWALLLYRQNSQRLEALSPASDILKRASVLNPLRLENKTPNSTPIQKNTNSKTC